MKRMVLLILVCTALFPALVFGAITGKVAGTVVDKETGDVLPGANIVIEGTSLGAATDVNGEFVILSVPVGTYRIRASFIGYRNVTMSNVQVNSDLTTRVNFELPPEALEVGDITIVAERPLVNKNATNAVRIQGFEEIQNIPTRSVTEVIALQPGVVVVDGDMHIRGGRTHDVGFYLEGANTRDAVTGANVVTVIPEALEEFQVEAGGYTAEYGSANAGIVRQTLKSGTPEYKFTVQAETDNFAEQGEKFLDTYSYGYSDYTLTASGPIPYTNNKLKFFIAGQNTFHRDRLRQFWNGFDFNNADSYVDANNFPLVSTTYNEEFDRIYMPDGNIPHASRNRYIANGTVVWDANPFQVRLGGSFMRQDQESVSTNLPGRVFNYGRVEQAAQSSALMNLKVTHILNARSFYEINLNYFDRRLKNYDPFFEDDIYSYWDSTANADLGYEFLSWSSPRAGRPIDIYGFNFTPNGNPTNYSKFKRSYMGGSFKLTTQYKDHEIKVGGDLQRWTTRGYWLDERTLLTNTRNNPDQFRKALDGDQKAYGELRNAISMNGFGYDAFGNELGDDAGFNGPKHPVYMSAFLQDRFEANDIVINAGLRLDYIDNDEYVFSDPQSPAWDPELHQLLLDQMVDKDPFIGVSPRLGFAFPASDRTVFHLQYGKFIQSPNLDDVHAGEGWIDRVFQGGFAFVTPPAFGLDPERTTQYEVGFQQQVSDNSSFDITAFYKDIDGQIQMGRVVTDINAAARTYNVLVNGDFATTKGLEFSFTLRRTNRIAAQVNYTYSSALGTGSVSNETFASIELGTATPTVINPLDWNTPHSGSVNFDYRFGQGDGGPILQRSGLNMLFTFSSGHPYTLFEGDFGQQDVSFAGMITDERSRRPLEAVNTSSTPWVYYLDLRLDKTVSLGPVDMNLYVYAQNLTNRRNVLNVFHRTGNAWDDGFLSNPEISGSIVQANGGEKFVHMHEAINLNGNGVSYLRYTGNDMFGLPRQIRVGIRFEY